MTVNPDNTYQVQYTPEDVGQYTVQVNFGGQPVANSPFPVRSVPTGACTYYLLLIILVVQVFLYWFRGLGLRPRGAPYN